VLLLVRGGSSGHRNELRPLAHPDTLVNAGVNIAGVWHDARDLLFLVAGRQSHRSCTVAEPRRRAIAPTPPAAKTQAISVSALAVNQWVLAVALLLGCALAIFSSCKRTPRIERRRGADLAALLPAAQLAGVVPAAPI